MAGIRKGRGDEVMLDREGLGEGLYQESVAIRPTEKDGVLKIIFCHKEVGQINLNAAKMATR